jgi:hypothetical protein
VLVASDWVLLRLLVALLPVVVGAVDQMDLEVRAGADCHTMFVLVALLPAFVSAVDLEDSDMCAAADCRTMFVLVLPSSQAGRCS